VRKLLLLLLFIPLVSFGQNISFKDLMSIDSKNTFIKLMVENSFAAIDSEVGGVSYALTPEKGDKGQDISAAFAWFTYNQFIFQFSRTGTRPNWEGIISNPYDELFSKVKRRCKFVKIKAVGKDNYACYDCRQAKYEGLIGFSAGNRNGIISQIKD
jgi:hypothetical protein